MAASGFDGFPTLKAIFTNPASEAHMVWRNETMYKNLSGIENAGSGNFICIVGAAHTSLELKTSLLSRCMKQHPGNTALINMVCKNCDSRSYFGTQHMDISSQVNLGDKALQLDAAYNTLYKPNTYSIIDQHSIKGLEDSYNELPTYYVLFKDEKSR